MLPSDFSVTPTPETVAQCFVEHHGWHPDDASAHVNAKLTPPTLAKHLADGLTTIQVAGALIVAHAAANQAATAERFARENEEHVARAAHRKAEIDKVEADKRTNELLKRAQAESAKTAAAVRAAADKASAEKAAKVRAASLAAMRAGNAPKPPPAPAQRPHASTAAPVAPVARPPVPTAAVRPAAPIPPRRR